MTNSNSFQFNVEDFIKAATNAVLVAVFVSISGVITQAGFDVFSADWIAILGQALNVGITAFVGFLGTNFLADKEGKLGGVQVK